MMIIKRAFSTSTAFILLALAARGRAATVTWDGGANPGVLWSAGQNWVGDTAPVSGDALVFDGTTGLSNTNDFAAATSFAGLTFASTAGAFVLGGNQITLTGDVVNNSTSLQTINTALAYATARTINTASGNITLTGTLSGGAGSQLVKSGTGTLLITAGTSTLGNAGQGLIQKQGTLRFDGGAAAIYTITGEVWIGDTTNANVAFIQDSGTTNISSWLASARGNGNGTVSSDITLNNAAKITAANFSVGYNAGSGANTPRGSVTLNGTSTLEITNNTNSCHIAESAGSRATITLNDSSLFKNNVSGSTSRIGVAGSALLNIASASATAALNQVHFGVGGSGAIWNRGILTVGSAASTNHFAIGQASGGYGYYLHDTPVATTLQEIGIGGAGGGHGTLEVRSGTLTINSWITINRGGNATSSTLYVAGGTLVPPSAAQFQANWGAPAGGQYAVIDVGAGGRINGSAAAEVNLNVTALAANTGLLTIHGGGIVEALRLNTSQTTSTTAVNFDNGTLVAKASDANFIANAFDGVFVLPGGAKFDTNTFSPTIPAPLAAPAGNGVVTIPVTAGGANYIGRPTVLITGGGGFGATAIANFNEATGAITGITITSPGSGYTSVPTVSLIGGGGTGATLGTVTIGANSAGGGITKLGSGTLTLGSAASTYGGPTVISAGTLAVATVGNGGAPSSLGASSSASGNLVFDGGTLQYTGGTAATDRGFSVNSGKTATIDVTTAATALTISGTAAATNGGLTKIGAGSLVLGGTNSLVGPVIVSAGTLESASAGAFGGATSVTQRNGAILRLGGGTVSLPSLALDLNAGTAASVSGLSGGTGNYNVEVLAGTSATVAGMVTNNGGSFVKRGPGSLTVSGSGASVLANVGSIAASVQDGSLILDGGASATYAVTAGEIAVGDNTPNAATLTLASGTLNVATFTSVGRGNGTTGLASTLNVTGGTLNTANLFTGYGNGVAGYNARPTINLSGSAVVNATANAANSGVRLGESAGSVATLNVSGSATLTSSGDFQAGFGGSAVITLSGGAINAGQFGLGYGNNAAANTGAAVLRQSGGSVSRTTAFGTDWRIGGFNTNDSLAYGAAMMTGGSFTTDRNFQIGAYGRGVFDVSGSATATANAGYPVIGRFATGVGVLNVSGGTFSQTAAGALLIIGELGSGVVNVSGGGTLSVAAGPGAAGIGGGTGGIRIGHGAGSVGVLNLNGGTVTATGIAKTVVGATGSVYLNGGTLKAGASNATFMQGLDAVIVGPGGAVIDTNGSSITVAQNLLAPGGNGITSVPVLTGGSGYLGPPIVQITGGGGTGATAVANVNASGVVTGITITNPGTGYTSAPAVALLGGAPTVAATLDVPGVGANSVSGGLTKQGNGVLTLTGANTYVGTTTVSGGRLRLNRSTADNSAIPTDGNTATTADIVINGGTLELAASEQIGNTGSISMSSGAFNFGVASGNTETIDTFTNSGGTFSTGANTLIGLGATMTWSGGTNTINNGGLVQDGHIVISGGTNTVEGGAAGGVLELLSGGTGLEMSNGATLTLNSDNAVAGKLKLGGDVSTTGNSTVTIASGLSNNNPGSIDLTGGTRTFMVANGTAAADLLVSAQITNGALTKAGDGTLTLSGANTYAGATNINGGTLLLGAANVLPNTSAVKLGGGTLRADGFSNATAGTLDLLSSSVIDYGTTGVGDSVLSFSKLNWTSGTLSVWNWTGAVWTSNGTEQLRFAILNNPVGDFANVQFYSGNGSGPVGVGGRFVDVGGGLVELVPVPEPGAVLAALLLLVPVASRQRGRSVRRV